VLWLVLLGSAETVGGALTATLLLSPLIWAGAAALVLGAVLLGVSLNRRAAISGFQEALAARAEGPRGGPGWPWAEGACPVRVASF
jgi:hypothetical protein